MTASFHFRQKRESTCKAPPPSGGLDLLASIIRNSPHTEKADVPLLAQLQGFLS